jgi:hypothetical protein
LHLDRFGGVGGCRHGLSRGCCGQNSRLERRLQRYQTSFQRSQLALGVDHALLGCLYLLLELPDLLNGDDLCR